MSGIDDVEEHREAFYLFDSVGDGKVDSRCVGDVLRALGLNPTQAEVGKMLKEIDPEGNKRITFEEFAPLFLTQKRKPSTHGFDNFTEAFRVFDRQNDGLVTCAEVRHLLSNLGEQLTSGDVDVLLVGMEDTNGMMNYEEFVRGVISG